MAFVPDLEQLRITDPDQTLPLARDQRTSLYSHRIRHAAFPSQFAVLDPDPALLEDPDFYDKLYKELGISAKIYRRARKTSSASWSIHDSLKTPETKAAAAWLKWCYSHIKNFNRAKKNLVAQGITRGWGIARISGRREKHCLQGPCNGLNFWVPTNLSSVSKERMRVNERSNHEVKQGLSRFYWTIQDTFSLRWHPLDFQGAPPGLRRHDYVWFRAEDDEDDLGYSHGLNRYLVKKWYKLVYLWSYAMAGAENWGNGKTIVKSPKIEGGPTLPGDLRGGAKNQGSIKKRLADDIAASMSRHVVVISDKEQIDILGQPTSGHEAIMDPLKEIKHEVHELVCGTNVEMLEPGQDDIALEVVHDDMSELEDALEDLKWSTVKWNRSPLAAAGIPLEAFNHVRLQISRARNMTPKELGEAMMVVTALGGGIHGDDAYLRMGLTRPDPNDPNVLFAPPPGSPVSAQTSAIIPQFKGYGGGAGQPSYPGGVSSPGPKFAA